MIKKLNYLWVAALLVAGACKKDNDEPATGTTSLVPFFTQLKPGNYWIYERYQVTPSGTATPLGIFDSCYVENDTTIGNRVYSTYVAPSSPGTGLTITYLRDSAGYLIDEQQNIYFSATDFTTIYSDEYIFSGVDTVARVTTQMADKDLQISVPAGSFGTHNFRKRYEMFPPYTTAGTIRDQNVRYGGGVGKVEERLPFFASNPDYVDRRLVRYHVQ